MRSDEDIVVIGSNCFTGSHIVDALLEDPANHVIGISRSPEYKPFFLPYKRFAAPSFQFVQLDLTKETEKVIALLDEVRPKVIINVAALSEVGLSNVSPNEYFAINTVAVVKLCNELRTRPYLKRYVHISSAEIFGNCSEPVDENTRFQPSTPYAVSKAAADMYVNVLRQNFGFPATLIRSTNVYGKHQQLFKIIPRTAIYLKQRKKIQLHGGGVSQKCFIHIKDVVRGLLLAVEQGKPGTYHFTVQSDRTVTHVVQLICHLMGYDYNSSVEFVDERLGQDTRYVLDCGKAQLELGWTPKVRFEDGVRETIDWIESHWDAVQREPLVYQHKI